MRIPNESLDDFKVSPKPKPAEPPAWVAVRPTGDFEVVKPLARMEVAAQREPAADAVVSPPAHRLSRFHQVMAVGGAAALVAFFLIAGLYIGIADRPVGPGQGDTALNTPPAKAVPPAKAPAAAGLSVAEAPLPAAGETPAARPPVRRRYARPRSSFAAYRQRRRPLLPQYVVSQFVPTTLIIYPENGEIKTRIEPWLAAAYRKPTTFRY